MVARRVVCHVFDLLYVRAGVARRDFYRPTPGRCDGADPSNNI